MHSNEFMQNRDIKKIHFVGVGGSGMSGIAELMFNQGFIVSGSDLQDNSATKRLKKLGAQIFKGHKKSHVADVDVVVVSSAVSDDNPELVAAKAARIPIVPRAQMLAELMRFRLGIAIAGSHGKTTTTSLVSTLLADAGLDPTFVIGGQLNSIGTHARLGESPYLVVEADESDASFLYLMPMIAVVTNIEPEHLAHYDSDFEKLKAAYVEFLHHLPFYGLAVICIDDPVLQELIDKIQRPILTYGESESADIQLVSYEQNGYKTEFTARIFDESTTTFSLNLPGKHNVLNALAAIAIAREIGVPIEKIQGTLNQFAGIGRRFQVYEQVMIGQKPIRLIDDYGHHPTEIGVTIQAIQAAWPEQRVVLVFQPHRYSRTRDLFEDFTSVLSSADMLILLEVYSAGEEPINHADSRSLCRSIRQRGGIDPIFVEDSESLVEILANVVEPNDIVLMQGAGDISKLTQLILQQRDSDNVVSIHQNQDGGC